MTKTPPSQALDITLRRGIKKSGLSHYAIGKMAEVQASQIDRFMLPEDDPRHRDLRLSTAGRVARVLGLRLVAG